MNVEEIFAAYYGQAQFAAGQSPLTRAVIELLGRWARMLDDGSALFAQPDRNGLDISLNRADEIVRTIDERVQFELDNYSSYHAAKGFTEPSDFKRLPPAARLALAQQLHAVYAQHESPPQPEPESIVTI